MHSHSGVFFRLSHYKAEHREGEEQTQLLCHFAALFASPLALSKRRRAVVSPYNVTQDFSVISLVLVFNSS